MSILFLKVKLKSLAAESRIIRHQERKTNGSIRCQLQEHRREVVRYEARHTHLAYGFLKGKPYTMLEQSCKSEPYWPKVLNMVKKYGFEFNDEVVKKFDKWTKNELSLVTN